MAALRTQIYLSADQRRRLDAERNRRGVTLATVVREAVDSYLTATPQAADDALDATFGAAPEFAVPSRDEWTRG